MVTQNIEQVQYLKSLINKNSDLELCAPAPLNILCFRYKGSLTDSEALNSLNKELLLQLHESGVALPSYTTLNGNYALRVANTNHRTLKSDFDILVNKVLELGRKPKSSLNHSITCASTRPPAWFPPPWFRLIPAASISASMANGVPLPITHPQKRG